MNLENSRVIELPISCGNINDAFTPLLLMTGHMHSDEMIDSVGLDIFVEKDGTKKVSFRIKKEANTTH